MCQSYIIIAKRKNKFLKRALESDIANYAIKKTQKRLFN